MARKTTVYGSIKSPILAWAALVVIPALVTAAFLLRVTRREQVRYAERLEQAALAEGRQVALDLRRHLQLLRGEAARALQAVEPTAWLRSLPAWSDDDPTIRNVFVWEPPGTTLHPTEAAGLTRDERAFLKRYEALLTGRVPWTLADGASDGPRPEQPAASTQDEPWPVSPKITPSKRKGVSVGRPVTWRCWSSQDRIGLLAWVRDPASSRIAGVEIELIDWLSRVVAQAPRTVSEELTCQLIDDAGAVFHQIGSQPGNREPDARVSLAPELPHWQLAIFTRVALPASARLVPWLTTILLLGAAIAMPTGAALLVRDARRSRMDAQRRTTFVSNVSHELKTPLTTIRMYAELLHARRIADEGRRRHYLQVIMDESQRLTRLVGNVLNFSRLEQNRRSYDAEDLPLAPFLAALVETQQPRAETAGCQLTLQQPVPDRTLAVDRDALEQVLLNLVDNAMKYAAGGGPIEVVAEETRDGVEIRVMDRGPGIPKRHRKRIFDAFHRVDDSLTACQPGTGLGLSISRRLVADCGGTLTFAPREGGGSVFTIRLVS